MMSSNQQKELLKSTGGSVLYRVRYGAKIKYVQFTAGTSKILQLSLIYLY